MEIVIGGTGLVGSHLLCQLVKTNEVVIATFQTKKKIEKVRKLFEFYFQTEAQSNWEKVVWKKVNILDVSELESLISANDEIYHCAAIVSFYKRDFNQLMKVNREGTTNVVNICLIQNIKKLVHVSSTAAITGGDVAVVDENAKWKKSDETSAYSISKYGAEREVYRGIEEGLNAVIVNPCVIFGAGDWRESSLTILQQIDKGLSFYPPGANAIVDARDVAILMEKLMKSERKNERYLLIGENISFQKLFEKIAIGLNKKPADRAVGKLGLHTARIAMWIVTKLQGKRSPITTETVSSALSTTVYKNDKIREALNYTFFSLDETIDNAIKGRILD